MVIYGIKHQREPLFDHFDGLLGGGKATRDVFATRIATAAEWIDDHQPKVGRQSFEHGPSIDDHACIGATSNQ